MTISRFSWMVIVVRPSIVVVHLCMYEFYYLYFTIIIIIIVI